MIIAVRVTPRSSKNEVCRLEDGTYKVKLTAAPVDGAANAALIRLLSREFKVGSSRITIIKGARGKKKRVAIR